MNPKWPPESLVPNRFKIFPKSFPEASCLLLAPIGALLAALGRLLGFLGPPPKKSGTIMEREARSARKRPAMQVEKEQEEEQERQEEHEPQQQEKSTSGQSRERKKKACTPPPEAQQMNQGGRGGHSLATDKFIRGEKS